MTFTALSDEGITVWGSKQENRSDEEVVQAIVEDLDLGNTSEVVSHLVLPTEGTTGAVIEWQTSDESVITNTGEIHRPSADEGPSTATLTATITKGSESATKSFDITVLPYQDASMTSHFSFDGSLTDQHGDFGSGTVTGDRLTNTGGSISYEQGVAGEAVYFDGESGILLPDDLITSHEYSVSFWVKPEQLTTYTTTFFGGTADSWLSLVPKGPTGDNTMLWSGEAWYDAPASYQIKTNEWTHVAFTVSNGTVKLYLNGKEEFLGANFPDIFTNAEADFGLAVNHWDSPFKGAIDDLRIYQGELSPNQLDELSQS